MLRQVMLFRRMKPRQPQQTNNMILPQNIATSTVTKARLVKKRWYLFATFFTVLFVGYTLAVKWLDVQLVDQQNIGWATVNLWWRDVVGVNQVWHIVSNVVAAVTILTVGGLLIWQMVAAYHVKRLQRLARHWWVLDVVLIGLGLCYLVFQLVVINHRPILIHGTAEVSYPSSHVLLFATVLPLAILTVWHTVKSRPWRMALTMGGLAMMVLGIVARTLSGYHWLTDVLGGMILGMALVAWYQAWNV